MRLLQLRFTNINSLAGTWNIDFTNPDFIRSPLFAIIGPTGSGKSTILDAVSLALYATTPRMKDMPPKIEGAETCPVLTKGEKSASAAVRFEVDGREYVSRWSRRTKRTGKLSEDEVELVAFASPEDQTGRPIATQKRQWEQEILRITHMTFPIFTRSVLLAQGAFSNFLKAADDERANLLEKITGTDLYSDISIKIFEKNREARVELDNARAKLAGMQILSDEDRSALEANLATLTVRVPALEKNAAELADALRWRQGLDKLLTALSARTEEEARAKAAEDAFKPELAKAENAERASLPVERHAELVRTQTSLVQRQSELKTAQERLETVRTARPGLEAALKTADEAAQKADAARNRFMPEYRRMLEADEAIKHLSDRAATAGTAAENACTAAKAARARLDKASNARQTAATSAAVLQSRMNASAADAELAGPLALLKQAVATLEMLKTQELQASQAVKALETRLAKGHVKTAELDKTAKIKTEQHAKCQTESESARRNLEAMQAKSNYESVLLRMKTLTEEIVLARHVETLLEQKGSIEASARRMCATAEPAWWSAEGLPEMQRLAEDLQSRLAAIETRHPGLSTVLSTPGNTHVNTLLAERGALDKWTSDFAEGDRIWRAALEKEQRTLEAKNLADKQLQTAQALLEKLDGDLSHARADLSKARESIKSEEAHAAELRQGLPNASDEPDLAQLCAALEARFKARKQLEADASRAAETLARADQALAVAQTEADKADEAKAAAEDTHARAKETHAESVKKRTDAFGERDPEAERAVHDRNVANAHAVLQKAQADLAKSEADEKECTARADTLKSTTTALEADVQAKSEGLADALAAAGFATIDAARAASLPSETIRTIKARMTKLGEARVSLSGEVAQLKRQVEEESAKSLTKETAEALAPQADKANAELLAGRDALSAARKSKIEDDRRRLEAADAHREITRLEELSRQWEQLNSLLGSHDGKKFRAAAQKLTFRILLKLANEAMKTMTPRYQLRAGGQSGLSLDVIDHEMGSQVRTSQNLSGGESFMVSLALALGLSRMGGKNLRVDTLFLDEGFGTLDEDTLNKALYALETLQKSSGKLIGIISHVKSIRERIDAQIVVTKRPGSGRSTLSGPGVTKIEAQ